MIRISEENTKKYFDPSTKELVDSKPEINETETKKKEIRKNMIINKSGK